MQTSRLKLSPNFAVEEFDCHDGTRVPSAAVPGLREWCRDWGEPLRARFGAVRVASGFRTQSYNRSVGGAPASYHRYDLHRNDRSPGRLVQPIAADCVPASGHVKDWQAWASATLARRQQNMTSSRGAAVGYPSSGFIHLDTGPRRTWAG